MQESSSILIDCFEIPSLDPLNLNSARYFKSSLLRFSTKNMPHFFHLYVSMAVYNNAKEFNTSKWGKINVTKKCPAFNHVHFYGFDKHLLLYKYLKNCFVIWTRAALYFIKNNRKSQCLKITEKVAFNIASEASIASFTIWVDKSTLKMPKMVNFGKFLKTWS